MLPVEGISKSFLKLTSKKKQLLLVGFILAFGLISALVFEDTIHENIHTEESDEFLITAQKRALLHELQNSLGYGGLIYHYNKFILEFDLPAVRKAQKNIVDARNVIAQLMDVINTQETEEFLYLDTMLDRYRIYFNNIAVLLESGAKKSSIPAIENIDEKRMVEIIKSVSSKWLDAQNELLNSHKNESHISFGFAFTLISIIFILLLCVFYFWQRSRNIFSKVMDTSYDLESSVEEYRALVTNTSDGIIYINREGFITFVNPAAASMFGYDAKELLGQSVNILLPASDRAAHSQYLASSHLHESRVINSLRGDLKGRHKDGHTFQIELNVSRILVNGKPHFAGIIRDISDRVRAQKELEELYEEAPNAYLSLSMENGEVLRHNKALETLLGYRGPEMIGKNILDFQPQDEDNLEGLRHWAEYFSGHNLDNVELRFLKKDGQEIWASVTAVSQVDESGDVAIGRAIIRDITIQKETRYQLEKAMGHADDANEAKTRFLSNMSHELRTPLNSILGHAQLLLNSKRHPLNDRQTRQVDSVYKSGIHLLALIDEVLDLALVESGQDHVSEEVISLSFILKEVMGFVETLPGQYGRKVNITSDFTDEDAYIFADRTRLRQVFLNLLSNAIKYNRDGGEVFIRSFRYEKDVSRIEVIDNGVGIPEDKLDEVFSPFKRLGAELTQVEGTGVGLYLTKIIVENMNGRIGLNTVVDEGTTFWVELPIVDQTDLAPEQTKILNDKLSRVGQHNKLILYIEDNPENVKFMEALVEELENVALITALSGKAGITLANLIRPDCILLDMNLPDIDGVKVLQDLKDKENTKNIPVAVVTSSIDPLMEEVMRELGCEAYLRKPVDLEHLLMYFESCFGEE